MHVNVVPGDQAAGRVPDPVVRTELAYLETQRAKREASTLLSDGDVAGALRHLRTAGGTVAAAMAYAPASLRADLGEESAVLADMIGDVESGAHARAAKLTSADATLKSRTRGRRRS
ncbi:hypothetical protein KZX45_06445 [Georgenia sp. EYE_87]|uniref:hypothetical protein n=1 Tax=Georgenia sp. EYE_87 TaxID=2853448 RepID=UPI00200543D8|nr:hypothetical protein [Georgenia sp. EYE_87]MCK6210181.1 hypothetical protein [Georgenia sp. EYE_87]